MDDPELLFLHALPLDGSMWAGQAKLLPNRVHAPTLYCRGDKLEAWAANALRLTTSNRLIVVGCSVGGSCALEIAALAPDRVAALVLIGTKARHRPEPELRDSALETLRRNAKEAWNAYWAPLFSPAADNRITAQAERIMLRQAPQDIARGIGVFHSRKSRDDVLSSFAGPVIMVSGEDDVAPGPETCAEQASAARNGKLHIVPRCGHYVPLERPEALNAILRETVASLR